MPLAVMFCTASLRIFLLRTLAWTRWSKQAVLFTFVLNWKIRDKKTFVSKKKNKLLPSHFCFMNHFFPSRKTVKNILNPLIYFNICLNWLSKANVPWEIFTGVQNCDNLPRLAPSLSHNLDGYCVVSDENNLIWQAGYPYNFLIFCSDRSPCVLSFIELTPVNQLQSSTVCVLWAWEPENRVEVKERNRNKRENK